MFASEPQSFESAEKPKEETRPEPQQPQLPADAQQVLNILSSGSLEQFVSAYFELLKGDSDNLVGFLNEKFQTQYKNIFEFLFNTYKANSQKEWNVKTFFITIMNVGLSFREQQASPNVYYYLLLTTENAPSPIYGLVQQLEPTKELNDHFINLWNGLFGKPPQKPKKESFMNMSKTSRTTIIFTLVALFVVLLVSAGYFFRKYGNGTGNGTGFTVPEIKAPTVPKLKPVSIGTVDF